MIFFILPPFFCGGKVAVVKIISNNFNIFNPYFAGSNPAAFHPFGFLFLSPLIPIKGDGEE